MHSLADGLANFSFLGRSRRFIWVRSKQLGTVSRPQCRYTVSAEVGRMRHLTPQKPLRVRRRGSDGRCRNEDRMRLLILPAFLLAGHHGERNTQNTAHLPRRTPNPIRWMGAAEAATGELYEWPNSTSFYGLLLTSCPAAGHARAPFQIGGFKSPINVRARPPFLVASVRSNDFRYL